jgi:ArsR family transcriptional regulator
MEEIQQIAAAMHAISHPTRLKILCFLGDHEKIVNEILEHAGSTQSNISQHIEVLRKSGILRSRRIHNRVYCSVVTADLLPIINNIQELFCATNQQQTHLNHLEKRLKASH